MYVDEERGIQWNPSLKDTPDTDTTVLRTLCRVPNMLGSIQDTLPGPQGVHIRGAPW